MEVVFVDIEYLRYATGTRREKDDTSVATCGGQHQPDGAYTIRKEPVLYSGSNNAPSTRCALDVEATSPPVPAPRLARRLQLGFLARLPTANSAIQRRAGETYCCDAGPTPRVTAARQHEGRRAPGSHAPWLVDTSVHLVLYTVLA